MNSGKKYLYVGVVALLIVTGVSLAYFDITIIGNDTAKGNKVVTGNLELTYTDKNEISLEEAFPGDSFNKTISVKNTGTKDVSYNLVWTELTNEITNDELVIEATCKRLNSSGTEEGTCESVSQTPIKLNTIKKNVSIEPNITHEYTIKVTFIDTGSVQNYNKNKSFSGKLGIEEYIPTQFEKDSWTTIATNVRNGNIDNYKVGDTRKIDMGDYGAHTLRIANTSTPSECSTEGFSQSACGFVLEFADIITTHVMNDTNTSAGGWSATSMRTFVNNDIYNVLPIDLKNAIIDTTAVSSYGNKDTANFTSTDKLYLLAPREVYSDWTTNRFSQDDTAKDLTRTLDYYTSQGVTTSNYSDSIKKIETYVYVWFLRSALSFSGGDFFTVGDKGFLFHEASATCGVSPAFRIG